MNPINNGLATKVRELRGKRGLSQEELAVRAGITSRTVQRIEAGSVWPFNHTLKHLSRALEVDIEEITATNGQNDRGNKRLVLFHLSPLLGFMVPFAQVLAPLVMWLVYRQEENEFNQQIREVLLFHALSTLLLVFGFLLIWLSYTAGYIIVGGAILTCTAITMWNAFRVSENLPSRYFPRLSGARKAHSAVSRQI